MSTVNSGGYDICKIPQVLGLWKNSTKIYILALCNHNNSKLLTVVSEFFVVAFSSL